MMKKALIAAALVVGVSGTAFAGNWMFFGNYTDQDTGEPIKSYVTDVARNGKHASVRVLTVPKHSPDKYGTAAFYCGQPRIYTECTIGGYNCAQYVLHNGTFAHDLYNYLCN